MSIPSALLRQTATVEPFVGEGGSGPLFGEPVTYPVRVQAKRSLTYAPTGEVSVSDAVMDMRPGAAVGDGDRVTVGGVVYTVMSASEVMGLTRPESIAVTLSRSTT